MIIRINTRANGDQLADYVSTLKDNDYIEILEVDGRDDANKDYLKQTILSMELNAKLTKCKNPFLNAQINPAYGEDRQMTRKDWYQAADILAEELGYQDQRRVIVLHNKKGRTHAHVVWERYNHETMKVVPTKNSRLKAKFALVRIEKELGHKRTNWINDKTQIKETLTGIWNQTADGAEFVKQARKQGFIVSSGTGNRPFMVVDRNGVSCDLVRQLNGVRTRDVRARLRTEKLVTDKEAIEIARKEQAKGSGKQEREKPQAKTSTDKLRNEFAETRKQATTENQEQIKQAKKQTLDFNDFIQSGKTMSKDVRVPEKEDNPKAKAANEFAENRNQVSDHDLEEQELLKAKIERQQQAIRDKRKNRGPRR